MFFLLLNTKYFKQNRINCVNYAKYFIFQFLFPIYNLFILNDIINKKASYIGVIL